MVNTVLNNKTGQVVLCDGYQTAATSLFNQIEEITKLKVIAATRGNRAELR